MTDSNVTVQLTYVGTMPATSAGSNMTYATSPVAIDRVPTIRYLANTADPTIGMSWTAEIFDDSGWAEGFYGVGYETAVGAEKLIWGSLVAMVRPYSSRRALS